MTRRQDEDVTVLSFTKSSLLGMSRDPHTLRTSSRACTCHRGCIARRTAVQVSKLEVVCLPAKKKLLHSSIISSTLMSSEASIINPSKSLAPFPCILFPQLLLRRSISFFNDFLIPLSNFQQLMFLFVGKNLKFKCRLVPFPN